MDDWRKAGFGLYVHWPFCQSKCPYCDFNSHVASQVDIDAWKAAFRREIQRLSADTGPRILNSIYFGGGTPSLMPPDLVGAILDEAQKVWGFSNHIEITLEANPGSVEVGRFTGYRTAGVNRVSLGVQALSDDDLRRLGRMHSTDEAIRALDVARNVFDRVSFDLIYGRQDQSLSSWEAELKRALALASEHMSLYQLTIEDGTVFFRRHQDGKLKGLPDEDLGADMYDLTQALCEDAGLPAYEVSNHASEGNESRHNLIYWRGGDYAGIGPGAHGRLTLDGVRYATETPLGPEAWLRQVQETGSGESLRNPLSQSDQWNERIMMGLRLTEGVDLKGCSLDQSTLSAIQDMKEFGLLSFEQDILRATRTGRPLLNAIIREILV